MRPLSTMRTPSDATRSAVEAVIVAPLRLSHQVYPVGGSRLGFDPHAERCLKAFSWCDDSESLPTRERTGGRGHRFDRHELLLAGGKDLRVGITGEEFQRDPQIAARQRKGLRRLA